MFLNKLQSNGNSNNHKFNGLHNHLFNNSTQELDQYKELNLSNNKSKQLETKYSKEKMIEDYWKDYLTEDEPYYKL